MKGLALIPALCAVTLVATQELATDYSKDRVLRVTSETSSLTETTSFSMERDGEPIEGFGSRGGGGTESVTSVIHLDTVLEHREGVPTKVMRVFEEVEGSASFGGGEESREMDRESPMDGETLILTLDEDGDVVAEMEGGGEPDSAAMLEGHSLALALDALLPDGEVSEGDSWEPDSEAVLRTLGLDIEGALFPRPERGDEEGGERGRRGGGWGRSMSGGSSSRLLREAEWETNATLNSGTEEVEGLECLVIELEFEADGELEETGFGGRGRDRVFSIGPDGAPWTVRETSYEVEMEGTLYISLEEARPVKLELEGEFTIDMHMERNRGDFSMTIQRTQEGEIEHMVTITEEDA